MDPEIIMFMYRTFYRTSESVNTYVLLLAYMSGQVCWRFSPHEYISRLSKALELLKSFGSTEFGPLGIGLPGQIEDVRRVVKPLLAAAANTPTLTVRIDESFREIGHADQRRQMVQLLSWLGHGVDVRIVFESSIWMRRFAWSYDPEIDVDELDGNVPDVAAFDVSSQCDTGQRAHGTVDDHVAAACEALETDGEVVATLDVSARKPARQLATRRSMRLLRTMTPTSLGTTSRTTCASFANTNS